MSQYHTALFQTKYWMTSHQKEVNCVQTPNYSTHRPWWTDEHHRYSGHHTVASVQIRQGGKLSVMSRFNADVVDLSAQWIANDWGWHSLILARIGFFCKAHINIGMVDSSIPGAFVVLMFIFIVSNRISPKPQSACLFVLSFSPLPISGWRESCGSIGFFLGSIAHGGGWQPCMSFI